MTSTLRWTSADLEALPDDGKRYEIIGGDLYVSRQPSWQHQYACGEVYASLQTWSRATGAGVANLAPGVIFADDDDVAPDVVWVSVERLSASLGADGKLHAAPELVVEVLSPGPTNERRDREAKRKLYSRREVREYWIVDWQRREVEVYQRARATGEPGQATELRPVAVLGTGDRLESPLLPGFACPVDQLFFPPATAL